MKSSLQRLTDWYARQCDGEWEHGYGFKIDTLDNPGVVLRVDLRGTCLESVPFEERKEATDSKDRWMVCRRNEGKFEAFGAVGRVEDLIDAFLRWAESHERSGAMSRPADLIEGLTLLMP